MNPNELIKFLRSAKRGDVEKRVLNHDLNDRFLNMRGCKQHIVYHSEGDVLTHADMVVHEASKLVKDAPVGYEDIYLLACLCHDIGKPIVTVFNEKKGYFTAYNHGEAGEQPAADYLKSVGFDSSIVEPVMLLVNRHLDPFSFIRNNTKAKGYRRLHKKLKDACLPVEVLTLLAKADHFGRICEEGVDTEETIAEFLKAYKAYEAEDEKRLGGTDEEQD